MGFLQTNWLWKWADLDLETLRALEKERFQITGQSGVREFRSITD